MQERGKEEKPETLIVPRGVENAEEHRLCRRRGERRGSRFPFRRSRAAPRRRSAILPSGQWGPWWPSDNRTSLTAAAAAADDSTPTPRAEVRFGHGDATTQFRRCVTVLTESPGPSSRVRGASRGHNRHPRGAPVLTARRRVCVTSNL